MIELLVVIAIIGLLASIILASLNTAQQKGRDARRISDIKEVQLALELYYDSTGSYPVQGSVVEASPAGSYASVISSSNNAFGLTPDYVSTTPMDPSQPSDGTTASPYYYQYESLESDGTTACTSGVCPDYLLVTHLEAGANSATWSTSSSPLSSVCPSGGGSAAPYSYCVHN